MHHNTMIMAVLVIIVVPLKLAHVFFLASLYIRKYEASYVHKRAKCFFCFVLFCFFFFSFPE